MIKFYCDGCGKELPDEEGPEHLHVEVGVDRAGLFFGMRGFGVDACGLVCASFAIRDKLEEYQKAKAANKGGENNDET